jgi:hypothetical protein
MRGYFCLFPKEAPSGLPRDCHVTALIVDDPEEIERVKHVLLEESNEVHMDSPVEVYVHGSGVLRTRKGEEVQVLHVVPDTMQIVKAQFLKKFALKSDVFGSAQQFHIRVCPEFDTNFKGFDLTLVKCVFSVR